MRYAWGIALLAGLAMGCDQKPNLSDQLRHYEVRASVLQTQKEAWQGYARLRDTSGMTPPKQFTEDDEAELQELRKRIASLKADGVRD